MAVGTETTSKPEPNDRERSPVAPVRNYWCRPAIAVPLLVALIGLVVPLLKKELPSVIVDLAHALAIAGKSMGRVTTYNHTAGDRSQVDVRRKENGSPSGRRSGCPPGGERASYQVQYGTRVRREWIAKKIQSTLRNGGVDIFVTELDDQLILETDLFKDEPNRAKAIAAIRHIEDLQRLCDVGFHRIALAWNQMSFPRTYALACDGTK